MNNIIRFLFYFLHVDCIKFNFNLNANETKCFADSIPKGVMNILTVNSKSPISLVLYNQNTSDPIYKRSDMSTIRIGFTSTSAGSHTACITLNAQEINLIEFSWAFGPEARDFSTIAKEEHLTVSAKILREVEAELKMTHANILLEQETIQETKKITDGVAWRTITLSLVTMLLLIIVTTAQAIHLRQFFRSKKLI